MYTKKQNIISFLENRFFKINIDIEIINKAPLLVSLYSNWLYRSTMSIHQKLILIDCTHTETAILEAILILKKHYSCTEIKHRNKELQAYLSKKMDSS